MLNDKGNNENTHNTNEKGVKFENDEDKNENTGSAAILHRRSHSGYHSDEVILIINILLLQSQSKSFSDSHNLLFNTYKLTIT